MNATPSVSDERLTATYGQAAALRDVDLELEPDEIVAVLGHNGAGKSTLLRSIARAHRSTSGQIELFGESIVDPGPSRVVRLGLSLVREGAPIFTHLTVEESLKVATRLARSRKQQPMPFEAERARGCAQRRSTAGALHRGRACGETERASDR
ncbi:MAG: ATP-binding cassette domain-containing protein [Actinomycetota bacterium]